MQKLPGFFLPRPPACAPSIHCHPPLPRARRASNPVPRTQQPPAYCAEDVAGDPVRNNG